MLIKVAILDMYDGVTNEGMRCIRKLLSRAEAENELTFSVTSFDVRGRNEVPGLDHDVYISSGGPGSPLESGAAWEPRYFKFIDALLAHNKTSDRKKHLLLICHSFQLVALHLGLGEVSRRKSTSFGVLPMHLTRAGRADSVLGELPDPFYAVDSRDYQLTNLHAERLTELSVEVLALEKMRPRIPLARAVMALRISPEVLATQFHPEADGDGMLRYMRTEERKQQVVTTYGERKYDEMVGLLADPTTIEATEAVIVPTFLRQALAGLMELIPAG